MKSQEKLLLYGILILVSLVMSLSACSPREDSTDESPSRISAKQSDVPQVSVTQIEQIRQKVRESELGKFPKAMWSAVNWLEDSTRIVVHIRTDGLEDPELQDRFCELAGELIQSGLLPGQSFDLYIIHVDDVQRCR
ncbi:MAG: hypothetical protein JSV01_04925 [Desulfobacterales bacterium]|nr:MAG: hypothetical protein JSV01_04925 [Desulfobacterales bacterium]